MGEFRPGPDPVFGVGVFLFGLMVMAIGGATTWHYVFNVGEGLLLLGAVMFLAAVAITARRQSGQTVGDIARDALGVAPPDSSPGKPDGKEEREQGSGRTTSSDRSEREGKITPGGLESRARVRRR